MTKLQMTSGIVTVATLAVTGYGLAQPAHACWFSCSDVNTDAKNTFTKEAAVTEINQRKLSQNQPLPQFETSLERQNLINRLKLWNKPDKVSYIYLLQFGKVMAFYTAKGKVSSLNSLVTNPTQLVDGFGNQCQSSSSSVCHEVPSPDLDGSYGDNPKGIFFWTTDGAYVEWSGDFMLSDQPLKLATQPELVREVQ